MISFQKHRDDVAALGIAKPLSRRKAVTNALGKVLVRNIHAQRAVPPFSNSAMDGFAVLRADLESGLQNFPIIGDVPAGHAPIVVEPGTAIRIMTGAAVIEEQKDQLAIIPVEDTDIPPGPIPLPKTINVNRLGNKSHLRSVGENCQIGDLVVPKGSIIDSGTLAALISTGITEVDVYDSLRVAVISTGDELGDFAQVPDSNSPMITSLVCSTSPATAMHYHCNDDPQAFSQLLAELDADLIITTGGISAGAKDVVKESLAVGFSVEFRTVAMQPGKPQGFGYVGATPIVCLPGNPVSAFVSFHLFVKPLIRRMSGMNNWDQTPIVQLRVDADFRPNPSRDLFIPCLIDWRTHLVSVAIPEGKGSHFVSSLAGTSGIIHLPVARGAAICSEEVSVFLL